jgi:hypothetical protein
VRAAIEAQDMEALKAVLSRLPHEQAAVVERLKAAGIVRKFLFMPINFQEE